MKTSRLISWLVAALVVGFGIGLLLLMQRQLERVRAQRDGGAKPAPTARPIRDRAPAKPLPPGAIR